MDTLSALEIFVRTVDATSFTRAARQLRITPSAVSRSITRLERELDARLLHRSTHAIALTEAGRAFYERTTRILADLRAAREALTDVQAKPRGVVRVDAPLGFGRLVVAPLLPAFLARYPDLRVELTMRDHRIDPIAEGVDVVFRIGKPRLHTVTARRLATARMVVCAAPSYLARRGTPRAPRELAHHDCLGLIVQGRALPWSFVRGGETIAIAPRGKLTSDHGEVLRDAAVAGLGIVRLLDLFVARDLAEGRLHSLLVDATPASTTAIYAMQPHHRRPSAKARAFIEHVDAAWQRG